MRRRNCSTTESLEPRLVLSAVSPRGSVDPPEDHSVDAESRSDSDVVASNGDSQRQTVHASQRQRNADEVIYRTVDQTRVFIPVAVAEDSSALSTDDTGFNDDRSKLEENGVRTDSWNDDTLAGDLKGDSLSADDRTSSLMDSTVDPDEARAGDVSDADESVSLVAAGIGFRRASASVSSDHTVFCRHNGPAAIGSETLTEEIRRRAPGLAGPDIADVVPSRSAPSPVFPDTGSWVSSLASSLKSWLTPDGLETGTATAIAETSVPFVAVAGSVTLAAAGRKGVIEADSSDVTESGSSSGKVERRSGRVIDRRRFRWIEFLTKNRTARRSGSEVWRERPASPVNLAEPDVSEAFAMSMLQPVNEEAFLMTPIHIAQKSAESEQEDSDSFWTPEVVASGAVAVAGGTVLRRSRRAQRRTTFRPVIDYTGTTLPRIEKI